MLEEVGEGGKIDLANAHFVLFSGSGSCNTDCDCPLCAPFCSQQWGYCQENTNNGRRKILLKDCVKKEAVTDKIILA